MPATSTDRLSGLTTSLAIKAPCKVVSTSAITLSGEQTIDGLAVIEGDRVLNAIEGGSVDNGIWLVKTGAWERAKDFNGNRDFVKGTLVVVGPNPDDTQIWQLITDDPQIGDVLEFTIMAGVTTAEERPVQRENRTATAGQTLFTLTGFYYTPGIGSMHVYVNGLLLPSSDYSETSTTSVTMLYGLDEDDEVEFIAGSGVNSLSAVDASMMPFQPAGTGAIASNVQAALREMGPTITASGAVSGVDCWAALQAYVDANPGKRLVLPPGTWVISQPLVIESDNTFLQGAGFGVSKILYTGASGDGVIFRAASTASTSAYLNNCGMDGITILRSTAATTGAGLRLVQCNGFRMGMVYVLNFPEGVVQEGGKEIRGDDLRVYLASSTYPSLVTGSSLFRSRAAAIDGGLWQPAYTTTFSKVTLAGGYAAEVCVLLERADGLSFEGGYISAGNEALVRIQPHYSGGHVSGVSFGTTYLDGINQVGGTVNGVEVLDDGFAGASIVNNIDISSCLLIGNFSGKGLYSTHPNIQTFKVDPDVFINVAGAEIDITSGDTGFDSWIGIPLTWTPTLTCATPGDLAVAYTTRTARMLRTRSGMVHLTWDIGTSSFTHTTASGNMWVTGAPISTSATIGVRPLGSAAFNGITKAGSTQFTPTIGSSSTTIEHYASGSASSFGNVAITDLPSGGTVILRGSISYPASELG